MTIYILETSWMLDYAPYIQVCSPACIAIDDWWGVAGVKIVLFFSIH